MTQTLTKTLEDSIVCALQDKSPLTLDELMESLKVEGKAVSSAELRATVLPLINTQRLQFTNDRKLKCI